MDQVPNQRLFLIDSFGFIFRAYHARARSGAPPMRTSTGLSTEAVYIFNNMLRKLAKQYDPPYIAAIFESGEATHRMQEFPEYKAPAQTSCNTRQKSIESLQEQGGYGTRRVGQSRRRHRAD